MYTAEDKKIGLLEKAVAVSLRPSHYIGWEIGTTAQEQGPKGSRDQKDQKKSFDSGVRQAALIWHEPYGQAMADWRLMEIYDTFKKTINYRPERFLALGEDLQKELEALCLPSTFSLESKQPLEDFDVFVVRKPLDIKKLESIEKIALEKSAPIFFIDEDQNSLEALYRALNVAASEKPVKTRPLLPYAAADSSRLKSWLEERPSRAVSNIRASRYRAQLRRSGWTRFISHLEQIQLIKNTLLLSGLPLVLSSAKRAKLALSFGPAVSVGWNSESEFFDMELERPLDTKEIAQVLGDFLPLGYSLENVWRIPRHFPSLESSLNWAEFLIEGPEDVCWSCLGDYVQACQKSLAPSVLVKKEKSGGKTDIIDLRAVLGECLFLEAPSNGIRQIKLGLRFGPKKNLKPEKILETLLGLNPKYIAREVKITRLALALEFQGGRKRYLGAPAQ